jgi:hypothetical protein
MHTSFDFYSLFFIWQIPNFPTKSIKWCNFTLTKMIQHNYPHSHNNLHNSFKVHEKYLFIENKFLVYIWLYINKIPVRCCGISTCNSYTL